LTLQELASTAETICPFEEPVYLEALCSYVREYVARRGLGQHPSWHREHLWKPGCRKAPLMRTCSMLPWTALYHPDVIYEADQWDEGWSRDPTENLMSWSTDTSENKKATYGSRWLSVTGQWWIALSSCRYFVGTSNILAVLW